MISWSVDKMQKVVIAFYCYVLSVWNSWCSPLQIKLSTVLTVQLTFCFQYNSPQRYQYSSLAAVTKLSFWVRWLSCYWCVAGCRNWRCITVGTWQTEGSWRVLGHCRDWHLWVSIRVIIWVPKRCPHFFIDLPWLPWCRWTCHLAAIWMTISWK
jgi:hypothetical protein